jgi:flavin reductase (DIM6/NTAB) family NADH-FMN oxidoreductase RutF
MYVRSAELDLAHCYKLLTGVVIPRPIAWITSVSDDGVVNLAPFSQFTILSYSPPIIGVSIGHKGRTPKDSLRNILARRTFVVNIPSYAMMEQVHASSAELGADVSEAEALSVSLRPTGVDGVPGVAQAQVRLECRLYRAETYGNDQSVLVSGVVDAFDIADDAVDNFRVDARTIDPLARLGGPNYARMAEYSTLAPVGATPAEVIDSRCE